MTPPPPPKRSGRYQSQTERDIAGLTARRERESAPEFVEAEVTGNYEGEELQAARARRPTPERFKRLEEFKDSATKDIGDIKVSVAKIEGEVKANSVSLVNIERHLSENRHRERIKFEAHVDVETAEKLDDIDARKAKRERTTKLVGGIIAVASSGALLHYLLGGLL